MRQREVPNEWRKAIIVPLHKGKGSNNECNNDNRISIVSVPDKIYGIVLNERLMQVKDEKVTDKQGGFRKGKECVDQIFAIKMIVEEYLGKDETLYTAFMELEKSYGRVDREALWNVLKIYGVGRQLMEGIKEFHREVSACMKADGKLSDNFAIGVGERQVCIVPVGI